MDPDRICMYLLKRLEEESLRCVPFVLIFGVGVMGDSGSPEASFMQNIFNLFTSRYIPVGFHCCFKYSVF
jgi:hypothetical protein